jgi:hypothetical protein
MAALKVYCIHLRTSDTIGHPTIWGREIGRKVEEVIVDENWFVAVGLQRSYIKNNKLPT